jgi:hypothetical protein
MGRKPRLSTVALIVLGAGCALLEPSQVTYLRQAQNTATQEDVKQKLGPPLQVRASEAGGTEWYYEFFAYDAGDRIHPGVSWCDQYWLTFDDQALLRRWTHKETRETTRLPCSLR